jgi:hypothetical protein
VEVRFGGSRSMAPASTKLQLVALPAAAGGLTVDPLPTLKVGQDATLTVVARLHAEGGDPVTGARVDVLVDGVLGRGASTDATGMARLQFREELEAGEHWLEVRFGGTRTVTPASITRPFTVLPAEVEVQVVPALAGVDVAVNGQVFTSGPDGVARLQFERVGAYRVEVLSGRRPSPPGRSSSSAGGRTRSSPPLGTS